MTTIGRAKDKLLIYTSVARYQVEVYMGLEKYQVVSEGSLLTSSS
jgi:hypothetical protein